MTENVYELLRLQQRLESYQRMHQEELDEIRRAIVELRNQILFNLAAPGAGFKREQEHLSPVDECSHSGFSGHQNDRIECNLQPGQRT